MFRRFEEIYSKFGLKYTPPIFSLICAMCLTFVLVISNDLPGYSQMITLPATILLLVLDCIIYEFLVLAIVFETLYRKYYFAFFSLVIFFALIPGIF